AGPGEIGADRVEEAGILLGVPQAVDRVALHQPHRAGVVIGPDGLGAVSFLGGDELLGDQVEGCLPTRLLPLSLALGARTYQRFEQAVRMVDALRVAGDLRADDAGRVGIVPGTMDAADAHTVEDFDIERAGGRAVVGTGRMADGDAGGSLADSGRSIHAANLPAFAA